MRNPYSAFRNAVREDPVDWLEAAIEIARVEDPAVDAGGMRAWFEESARGAAGAVGGAIGREAVERFGSHFAGTLKFAGNEDNYQDPDNSYIHRVIGRRLGIPITLSLVYAEIARRIAMSVDGVPMPFHYIVAVRDGRRRFLVDPFHGARIVTTEECRARVSKIAGRAVALSASHFRAGTARDAVVRMLTNLKNLHFKAGDYGRAARAAEMILIAEPWRSLEWRDIGVALLEDGQYGRALDHLERFLRFAPADSDRRVVEQKVKELRAFISAMN